MFLSCICKWNVTEELWEKTSQYCPNKQASQSLRTDCSKFGSMKLCWNDLANKGQTPAIFTNHALKGLFSFALVACLGTCSAWAFLSGVRDVHAERPAYGSGSKWAPRSMLVASHRSPRNLALALNLCQPGMCPKGRLIVDQITLPTSRSTGELKQCRPQLNPTTLPLWDAQRTPG